MDNDDFIKQYNLANKNLDNTSSRKEIKKLLEKFKEKIVNPDELLIFEINLNHNIDVAVFNTIKEWVGKKQLLIYR